jgi:hypothetical protein
LVNFEGELIELVVDEDEEEEADIPSEASDEEGDSKEDSSN